MRVHKHKRGVNCVAKFSQFSEDRLRPCSDRLFVTRPENANAVRIREEKVNTGFLRGKHI